MANRKIEDVEGIGLVRGGKFRAAGVQGADSLLQHGATPAKRIAQAEASCRVDSNTERSDP